MEERSGHLLQVISHLSISNIKCFMTRWAEGHIREDIYCWGYKYFNDILLVFDSWWCWRDLKLCQLIILPCHKISIYFMGSEVARASADPISLPILFACLHIMATLCSVCRSLNHAMILFVSEGDGMGASCLRRCINTPRWWPPCQIDWERREEPNPQCQGGHTGFWRE